MQKPLVHSVLLCLILAGFAHADVYEQGGMVTATPGPKPKPHYSACKDQDLSETSAVSTTEATYCSNCDGEEAKQNSTVASAQAISSVVSSTTKENKHQEFTQKLKKRVMGQVHSKLFQLRMLKACVKPDTSWFKGKIRNTLSRPIKGQCKKQKQGILDSIKEKWPKMRSNLALSDSNHLNLEAIVTNNRQLGMGSGHDRKSRGPYGIDDTLAHSLGHFTDDLPPLNSGEIDSVRDQTKEHLLNFAKTNPDFFENQALSAEQFETRVKEGKSLLKDESGKDLLAPKAMRALRSYIKSQAEQNYHQEVSDMPLLGYLKTGSPKDQELTSAFSKMETELQEFLEKVEKDNNLNLLMTFSPLVEDLVTQDPTFCEVAEKAHLEMQGDESLKNMGLLAGALVSAVPCFFTGPAILLCLAGGLAVGVVGLEMASNRLESSMGRFLTGQQFEDLAGLSDKEREVMLEKLLLPMAFFGVTSGTLRSARALYNMAKKGRQGLGRSGGGSSSSVAGRGGSSTTGGSSAGEQAIRAADESLSPVNISAPERTRLSRSYASVLNDKPEEEQQVLMEAILGMEFQGVPKGRIVDKVSKAISQCKK